MDILSALNDKRDAWRKGFLGYVQKSCTIHDNPYSFNRNRAKHDQWLDGRRVARKWTDDDL